MPKPIIEQPLTKRICKKITSFCETWMVKHILRPVFFLMPPAFLTLIATREGLRDNIVKYTSASTGEYLNNSAILILLITYLYVVIMKAIYAWIVNHAKPEKELEVGDLLALLKAIDIVVSDKTKRMSMEAKLLLNKDRACGQKTFLQITRPDQQIPLLIGGIRNVFEYMDNTDTVFRVGLLKIENNKPIDWYSFDPVSLPPRTPAKALKTPTSTVAHCIKTRSIVVIEDIQKELSKKAKKDRHFVKSNVQDSDEGSQLCYPLIHPATGNIEYVFTIAGNRANCLNKKHKELYSWIIEHFSVRVSMEHSLLIMREKAANEPEKIAA